MNTDNEATKRTDLDVETDILANVLELEHDDGQTYAERQQRITRTRNERGTASRLTIIVDIIHVLYRVIR